jgi:hypothetical protein
VLEMVQLGQDSNCLARAPSTHSTCLHQLLHTASRFSTCSNTLSF